MQATIYNLDGEEVEKIELDDAIFGITPNHAAIQQAVLRQQANARQGTHDTKTRAEVRRRQEAVAAEGHRTCPPGFDPLSSVEARRRGVRPASSLL